MRHYHLAAFFLLMGCYDLTFGEEDHIVDDLQVMAVHFSPPEIRPNEAIEAEVLYANPDSGKRPVWFAWRVFYPRTDGSGETKIETWAATDEEGGNRFSVTPLEEPAILAGPPFATFEVFLCAGRLNQPSRLTTLPTAELFEEDLCLGAPLLAAAKRAEIFDPEYPQNNPAFDRVLLNGEVLIAAENNGKGEVRCVELKECVAELRVYLSPDSQETYVNRNYDGKVISDELDEALKVEWFVSAGRLMPPVVRAIESRGPYVTFWYPNARGPHTLWAVVRDSRGGNNWQMFHVNIVIDP